MRACLIPISNQRVTAGSGWLFLFFYGISVDVCSIIVVACAPPHIASHHSVTSHSANRGKRITYGRHETSGASKLSGLRLAQGAHSSPRVASSQLETTNSREEQSKALGSMSSSSLSSSDGASCSCERLNQLLTAVIK